MAADALSEPFVNMLLTEANKGRTENNAVAFRSTLNACLDFFFEVVPRIPKERVERLLDAAWREDAALALKLVFQLRSVRDGKSDNGENFFVCLKWLQEHHFETLLKNLQHVPEFGYWKDLLNYIKSFLELPGPTVLHRVRLPKKPSRSECVEKQVVHRKAYAPQKPYDHKIACEQWKQKIKSDEKLSRLFAQAAKIFASQLRADLENIGDKTKSVSLAAKWAPTPKKSNDRYIFFCSALAHELFPDLEHRKLEMYRKQVLSPLRRHLKVTELSMSTQKWSDIAYERVPSVCMKNSKHTFEKHDRDRFTAYIEEVNSGKKKMTSGALLPHQIIGELNKDDLSREVAEAQWKSYVTDLRKSGLLSNCLAVADVSGSMAGDPMEVSIALSILIADCSQDPWNEVVCTFSQRPSFVRLVKGSRLAERVRVVREMDWGGNTDLVAVFRMILKLARENNLAPEQMVKKLFIFSDMEFDEAVSTPGSGASDWNSGKTIYEIVKEEFERVGYKLPQVVFWNLRSNGRGSSKPVTATQVDVALVSGFSGRLVKLFLEGSEDLMNPMKVMMDAVSAAHYELLEVVD